MKQSTVLSDSLMYSMSEFSILNKALMNKDDIASLDIERVDQCLLATKTKHPSGVRLARTIEEKAAILFFELLRQPISRSKSRIMSVATLLMFLYTHGYWLTMPQHEFVTLISWIEKSHALAQKETIVATRRILGSYIVELK